MYKTIVLYISLKFYHFKMGTLNFNRVLESAITRGASDIHLKVGYGPVLRVHGKF